MTSDLRFVDGDLTHPAVRDLVRAHLAAAHANSPPGFVHALDPSALCGEDVTFWSVWRGAELVGMGALKRLDAAHGEIKSMRVVEDFQRQGIGRAMLDHLIECARSAGMVRVSLETGGNAAFAPARAMYEDAGFTPCDGFGGYKPGEFTRLYSKLL